MTWRNLVLAHEAVKILTRVGILGSDGNSQKNDGGKVKHFEKVSTFKDNKTDKYKIWSSTNVKYKVNDNLNSFGF